MLILHSFASSYSLLPRDALAPEQPNRKLQALHTQNLERYSLSTWASANPESFGTHEVRKYSGRIASRAPASAAFRMKFWARLKLSSTCIGLEWSWITAHFHFDGISDIFDGRFVSSVVQVVYVGHRKSTVAHRCFGSVFDGFPRPMSYDSMR